MADELAQIKGNEEMLRQAYRDAGGTELDRGHNSCLWCASHDALSRFERDGRWQVKCQSCGGGGSIVDVVMVARGCDSREAIKVVLGKAQTPAVPVPKAPLPKGEGSGKPPPEGGKTHRDPDSAFEAALWVLHKREPGAVMVRKWVYQRANCEPFGQVARFDIPRVDEAGGPYVDKEFRPIVFVGNGWKLTARNHKGEKWPMYGLNRVVKALKEAGK